MTDNNQENINKHGEQSGKSSMSPSTTLASNNSSDYRMFYKDVFSLTEENKTSPTELFSDYKLISTDDDPLNDPQFMAFLACLPYEKTNAMDQELLVEDNSEPIREYDTKVDKKRSASTRFGYCEHPRHSYYRQEKYLWASSTVDQALVMKAVPRRGRPPKGSKSTDSVLSTSPVPQAHDSSHFSSVELTVRSLPKRLEPVVGKSNIKVCLTCLKRSDTDPDYLQSALYIGPQHQIMKQKREK